MELAAIVVGAAALAFALQHSVRPRPAAHLDPYTVWMMRNLPGRRAWHR